MKPTPTPKITTNFANFNFQDYYLEYIAQINDENRALLKFYHNLYQQMNPAKTFLAIGGSFTPYHLISASSKVKEIVFTDFLKKNQEELHRWMIQDPNAYSWDNYFYHVAGLENIKITERSIQDLKSRVKTKIKQITKSDLRQENILAPHTYKPFDIVSVTSCPESITTKEHEFLTYMNRIDAMVKPKGMLVQFFCKDMNYWKNGANYFPGFPVSEKYAIELYKKLGYTIISTASTHQENFQELGYSGLFMIAGRKN